MNTTIFYVNSAGMLAEWTGKVISHDAVSVVLKINGKVLRFALKQLGADFLVVTKTKLAKRSGLAFGDCMEAVSFDEELKAKVLAHVGENVAMRWNADGWVDMTRQTLFPC